MFFLPYLLFAKVHRHALDARRRDRTWRYLMWSGVAALCAVVQLVVLFSLTSLLLVVGLWWIAIPFALLIAIPVLEPALMRHAFVPLGWVRGAYVLSRGSTLGTDPEAYALCTAAWAHAHRPTPAGEAWLIAQRDKRVPLGDTEVVITALLAAGRGDAGTARVLLRSTLELVEVHVRVRELAGEWLACDAAERHAWTELHQDATAARWPASPLTYLLEGVAARRVGADGAPSKRELVARWIVAPHRRATGALLADVARPRPPVSSGDPHGDDARDAPPTVAIAPMPRAIAAYLALVESPGPGDGADALAHAVRAWDDALADDALRAWIARRAFELDAPLGAADRVVADLATGITAELERVALAAQLAAPAGKGPVGGPLAHRLRHGRLDALEAGFKRWDDRRKYGENRSAIDEWREWVALRAAYDDAAAAGGTELRRLAFPHAYSTGTNMAVWLWNTRKEYPLSHAISTWLLAEALAVGDAQAIDVCTQNTRLAVPTRLGKFVPS